MTDAPETRSTVIKIPPNLSVADAQEVYQRLRSALEEANADNSVAQVTFDGNPADASPLALQLMASATRSFPDDSLVIDASGRAALDTLSYAEGA